MEKSLSPGIEPKPYHASCCLEPHSQGSQSVSSRAPGSEIPGSGDAQSPCAPNCDSEPFYRYRGLGTRRRTRVLFVDPHLSSDGLIQCFLRKMRLADQHTCLSYMWGKGQAQHHIHVNGKPFKVRTNLWDFLQIARRHYAEQPLWIDAICINQENHSERAQQVTLMGEIYALSKQVLVYLGSGPSDIPQAMARVGATAAAMSRQNSMSTEPALQTRSMTIGLLYFWCELSETCEWHGLTQLCELPYWKRVWIKQEILKAASTRLLWGDSSCAWDDFARIIYPISVSGFDSSRDKATSRRRIGISAVIPLAELYLSKASRYRRIEEDPVTLIAEFCSSECAEVRDSVYGLLGLTNLGHTFHVDYSCSRKMLLMRTLIHCMKVGCRGSLGGIQHDVGLDKLLKLGTSLARALRLNYAELNESTQVEPMISQKTAPHPQGPIIVVHGDLWGRCIGIEENRAVWTTGYLTGHIPANIEQERSKLWSSDRLDTASQQSLFQEGTFRSFWSASHFTLSAVPAIVANIRLLHL